METGENGVRRISRGFSVSGFTAFGVEALDGGCGEHHARDILVMNVYDNGYNNASGADMDEAGGILIYRDNTASAGSRNLFIRGQRTGGNLIFQVARASTLRPISETLGQQPKAIQRWSLRRYQPLDLSCSAASVTPGCRSLCRVEPSSVILRTAGKCPFRFHTAP